jgi:hypothetical protein
MRQCPSPVLAQLLAVGWRKPDRRPEGTSLDDPLGELTKLRRLLEREAMGRAVDLEFIPGLSALDSSAQIISWAVLLGYSQQPLTRFVDQRAQTVLDNFSRTRAPQQQAHGALDSAPAPS